jgi:hypothetical protein
MPAMRVSVRTCRLLLKTYLACAVQLHLDRNNARDDFGIEMGQTLMVNNTLRFLNLSENDLRAPGLLPTQ